MATEQIREYLEGKRLYGDDFDQTQLRQWFEDEAEGYANLSGASSQSSEKQQQQYGYHGLNNKYGFCYLPSDQEFTNALGFGSAFGEELKPVLNRVRNLIVIEPSDSFIVEQIDNTPITYVKPELDGSLRFDHNSLDLITCFGVLHHIANVSKVVSEFYRCLKPDGYLLMREPIVSMGDWRKPRPGLTKRERGIPLHIFRDIISSTNFVVISEKKCMFSLTSRLKLLAKGPVYNSQLALFTDRLLSELFSWNRKYHATTVFEKLRPTSVFYVLQK